MGGNRQQRSTARVFVCLVIALCGNADAFNLADLLSGKLLDRNWEQLLELFAKLEHLYLFKQGLLESLEH